MLPMILSVLMPGLGQIVTGRIFHGLAWLVAVSVAYVPLIVPGILLHVLCVVHAGRLFQKDIGREEGVPTTS